MSQPVEEFPNPNPSQVTTEQQPDSSLSDGSFGPVFAVLAVIVVISAVACVLGRLCSRRRNRAKEAAHHHSDKGSKKKSNGLGPKEWEPRQKQPSFNMRDGDIEFGFDKKTTPSAKGAKNGNGGGGGGKAKPPQHNNGGHKQPEFRFSDNV
ncbi:hypothetical protein ABFS82_12G117700 [Erythranthe guttata]